MGDAILNQSPGQASHQPERLERKFNEELQAGPVTLSEANRLGATKEAPGYPMPELTLVGDRTRVKDNAGQTLAGQEIIPLERVSPKEAAAYLNSDGQKLPPIARDFKQIGLNALSDKEANDARKPQIHVAKTAGDSRYPLGSELNPYNSIQKAVDAARPGTVINVHKGNQSYNEAVSIKKSDIVLTTDKNNPAVIDLKNGGGREGQGAITIGSGSHNIDIKNFEIKNFGGYQAGIKVEGRDIKNINIAGNDIHSANLAEGIRIYGTGADEKSKISNVNILGNEVHDINLGELEAIPINGNVDGFRVIGNAGHHLNNIFIDAIGGEKVSPNDQYNKARNGEIDFNYASGVSTKSGAPDNRHNGEHSAAAIYTDAASDIKIRNNYIVGSDFGIEVGSEHEGLSSTRVAVTGNVVRDSGFAWLGRGGDPKRPGGAEDSYAKNNVVIGNDNAELQSHVRNFPVTNNPSAPRMSDLSQLPAPLAALVRHNARRSRP